MAASAVIRDTINVRNQRFPANSGGELVRDMKTTIFKRSPVALAAIITWASVHLAGAETVIPLQSYWQMWIGRQDASSPSTAWRAPEFNDSGWDRTLVPAGYSSSDPRTGIEAQLVSFLV